MIDLSKPPQKQPTKPPFIIVYGEPGIGKSKFASDAPKPFFLDVEKSLKYLQREVAEKDGRIERINDYSYLLECLDALESQTHDYRTVVIDTIDWAEHLIHKKICEDSKAKSITDKRNETTSYGNGYVLAANYARQLVEKLDSLNENKNMIVIILAHSQIKKIEDPEGEAHDRHVLKMHEKFYPILIEKSDAVLYATREQIMAGGAKIMPGKHILKTGNTFGATAKNRLGLPPVIDMSWQSFVTSVNLTKKKEGE